MPFKQQPHGEIEDILSILTLERGHFKIKVRKNVRNFHVSPNNNIWDWGSFFLFFRVTQGKRRRRTECKI